jgi:CCDC81-like prokaryotic HU domain 1/CCDC81-like prokaryotic HU domain 2
LEKLISHIEALLPEHDCVVVPGFGGFVQNEVSAHVDSVTDLFYPNVKEIYFNSKLIFNDGLLAQAYQESSHLSFEEANLLIRVEVQEIKDKLDQVKYLSMGRIGTMSKNDQGIFIFRSVSKNNFYPESFGLAPFSYQSLEKRIQNKNAVERSTKKHKQDEFIHIRLSRNNFRNFITGAAACLFILFLPKPAGNLSDTKNQQAFMMHDYLMSSKTQVKHTLRDQPISDSENISVDDIIKSSTAESDAKELATGIVPETNPVIEEEPIVKLTAEQAKEEAKALAVKAEKAKAEAKALAIKEAKAKSQELADAKALALKEEKAKAKELADAKALAIIKAKAKAQELADANELTLKEEKAKAKALAEAKAISIKVEKAKAEANALAIKVEKAKALALKQEEIKMLAIKAERESSFAKSKAQKAALAKSDAKKAEIAKTEAKKQEIAKAEAKKAEAKMEWAKNEARALAVKDELAKIKMKAQMAKDEQAKAQKKATAANQAISQASVQATAPKTVHATTPATVQATAPTPTPAQTRLAKTAENIKISHASNLAYYIVVSSFPQLDLAEQWLRTKNSDSLFRNNSGIIEKDNRARVFIKSFTDKQNAEAYLSKLKANNPKYASAWMLSAKND